jgi:transcriptional regulator with XRE-family HTH domain
MLDKRLSTRLRALRKEQGLTVKRVAALLDVSEQHVHGIEGGYGSQPSLNAIEDLARIYKVDEADLFVFPGEGLRHDIREELRRVPSIDGDKLAAILKVMRELVRVDTATIEALFDHLGGGGGGRKKRRRPTPPKAPKD